MSKYTDEEHLWAIDTVAEWAKKTPKTAEEYYEYGKLQYRLKDFYKAAVCYRQAIGQGYAPAKLALAFCMFFEEGCHREPSYETIAREGFLYYRSIVSQTEEDAYDLGKSYAYGVGTTKNFETAKCYLEKAGECHGGALYELGRLYETEKKDTAAAMSYYRKAYDRNYDDAIFRHYALHLASGGSFDDYPYQKEIKEGYSFRIGQYMRIATIAPCRDSYDRLAKMYENGYPGDQGEEDIRFREKGKEFRKACEAAQEEFAYGCFLTYPDSEIYQKWISVKDMSAFEQSGFLAENFS